MWLHRAIQFHVAALSVLGAIFIGLRHETSLVPALSAIVAVAALIVTDRFGWIRLNRWLANSIIVVAVGWSLREFIEISPEEKLMAIASMLCYIQIVLLFQEKTLRIYWQLIVLSTLQVVVAAALDLGPHFGVLLILYAVIAISALLLMYLLREIRSLETAATIASRSPAVKHRWQELLAPPQLGPAQVTDAELRRAVTPWLLARQTILLSSVTLFFAAVFFFATPRVGDRSWLTSRVGGNAVGFKPEISLENRGRIHLSSQIVMRVALSRSKDHRPVDLYGEPYFQGEVLTDYLPEDGGGRWIPWRPPASSSGERQGGLRLQTTSTLVRQDIVLEPTTSRRRFAIMPVQYGAELLFGSPRRSEPENFTIPRQQRYSFDTPAIVSGRQLHAIPIRPPPSDIPDRVEVEKERALAFEESRFPRLAEIASKVIEEHELQSGANFDKALALERHFLEQDAYHYSLNLNVGREYDRDPIEDFVTNQRTGHCNYFASALAMMLRSQGIPARVITGYKGGSFNSVGQYFVIQQRHAHAWVEAWLTSDEIPPSEFAGMPSDFGAWYRLDPTPGSDAVMITSDTGLGSRVAQAFDYVELLWRDYVLSLNPNRQEEIVYNPMQARTALLPSWVESRSVQRWLRRMSSLWGLEFGQDRSRSSGRAFEGSAAVLIIGGLVLLLIVVQGARLASRLLWRKGRGRSIDARSTHRPPRFYRRMEQLLARLPLRRERGQTAAELACAAQARLVRVEGAALTCHVPGEVVEAYYRVRFGDHRLDNSETAAIEQALDALAPAVRQARGKKPEVRSQKSESR